MGTEQVSDCDTGSERRSAHAAGEATGGTGGKYYRYWRQVLAVLATGPVGNGRGGE